MLTVRSTINIAGQTVPQIIPVVQGDTGRAILFTLADFTIPAGATATYYVQKPSGEAVYNNATIDGNNVLVELTAQSIIEKGDNYGQVRITVGEEVVTSFDFILLVKEFRGIDAVQSLTEMNIFDKAVEQASEAIDEVKTDALEAIDDAKDEAIEEVTSNFDLKLDASSTKGVQNQVITQAINTVNNAIGDLSGETVTPTATNNYGVGGNVGQVIETWATTMYWHGIYAVTAGNRYAIQTVSDYPQQLVVWFTNASNTIIENHKAFATDHVEMVCTAPTGATKLFVMSYGYDAYHGTVQKVEPLSETVSNLKEDLPNTYVALAGENQVTPQNIAGVTFTKAEEEIAGENIFSETYLGENGYYASVDTDTNPPKIAHAISASYRWYAIPVDGEKKYRFTEARFACLAKGNTVGSEAIGTTLANVTKVTTTSETTYLILSYSSSITNVEVHPITVVDVYSNFVLPDWLKGGVAKPKHISTTGNLSDGSFIALMGYKQNLRNGERYVFSGDLATMSELHFGFTYVNSFSASTTIFNEFTIDGAYITYKTDSTRLSYNNRYEHGLTLTNNIQFIFEYLPEGNAKITLISNGMMFSQTLPFVKQTISQVVALSVGSVLTNCKLSWIPINIDKDIWMFGDSYFAYDPARWTYYLQQYGYAKNVLLDGWPGEGSVNARNSLMTLIQFGTPKYIVWCMGMNDGSDTDASTPNTDWATRRDEMLTICDKNGVTPIFATIPNVPSILHTGKNAWIKASDYRYIDFAAAVGAESAGATWFSGMLSSDNIHPTEQGARALFARALVDLPELMLNE